HYYIIRGRFYGEGRKGYLSRKGGEGCVGRDANAEKTGIRREIGGNGTGLRQGYGVILKGSGRESNGS
ncbi:hypothetical protein, partial [Bacteroides fragilis]|uniref:hypothetical protein n=1 Tax=Bacteroides fragilis TaxID=817 RepID=UPI001F2191B6